MTYADRADKLTHLRDNHTTLAETNLKNSQPRPGQRGVPNHEYRMRSLAEANVHATLALLYQYRLETLPQP